MSPRVKEPKAGADRPRGSGSRGRRSGGLGSLPRSPRRGSAGKSFPEDAGHGRRGSAGDSCKTSGSGAAPRDPEAAEPGGAGPARRFLPPPRCQMCTRSPRACAPTLPPRRDVPSTCFQFSPSSVPVPGAPRTPRSPQRPGDTRLRHLWHPHPLMAFLAARGGLGERSVRVPPWHRAALAQINPGVQQPRPQQSRAGQGVQDPSPSRPALPNPSLPGIPPDPPQAGSCPWRGPGK